MTTYTDMWDRIEDRYRPTYGEAMEAYKAEVNMRELAIIGRAGYGLWQGGELMTGALIANGKYAKVIFLMPGERQNSPTRSYIRYADSPIAFPASDIYKADHMIVIEPSILKFRSMAFDIDIPAQTRKMDDKGLILVNSAKSPAEIEAESDARIATVDATSIAIEHLGNPLHTNTALMGAYIAATGVMSLDDFATAIHNYKDPRERMVYAGEKGQRNIGAAKAGFEALQM
jgi:pyruvate ferredoxin oxidoreductase gamma subunit